MKKIALFVSNILNPSFLILCLILIGIEKSPFTQSEMIFLSMGILVLNGLLPFLILLYLIKKGLVFDDILTNKEVLKVRPKIIFFGVLILFFETLFINFINKPQPLLTILTSSLLLLLLLFLISFSKKISLHTAGVTLFSFTIFFLYSFKTFPIFFLIPIVIWSRFYLFRHTLKQVIAAFFLAITVVFLTFWFYNLLPSG